MMNEYVNRQMLIATETFYKELVSQNNEEFIRHSPLAKSTRDFIKKLRKDRIDNSYYIFDKEFELRYC